jgi:hypothetical protein
MKLWIKKKFTYTLVLWLVHRFQINSTKFYGPILPEKNFLKNGQISAENFVKIVREIGDHFFMENSAEFSMKNGFSMEKNVREIDPSFGIMCQEKSGNPVYKT